MKKKIILIAGALLAALFVYLLWPLADHKWDITFDQEMIDRKNRFLEGLSNRAGGKTAAKKRPNIVLILADDLGTMDTSLYGGTLLETPNIDAIGTEGVTFTQSYATAAICAPSRAGMMTGRDQNRFGFGCQMIDIYLRNRLTFAIADAFVETDAMDPVFRTEVPRKSETWKQGVPPSEITLGELLQASDYETRMIGKWHIGYHDIHHPINRGFDYHFGFIEAYAFYAEERREDIVNYHHDLFWEKEIWNRAGRGPSAISRNGEDVKEERYLTDAFADEAVEYIASKGEDGEPFFLYLPFNAPHTPFQATREYYEKFSHIEDKAQRIYAAMIAHLDDAVGRIIEAVEKEGLSDNTLIIFSSDNGCAEYAEGNTNEPLRGGKMTFFDGGLQVPFMMRWDGVITPGTVVDDPVIQTDIFATAAAAAETPLPDDRVYDGKDLIPYVTGRGSGTEKPIPGPIHDTLFWKTLYGGMVRKGPWKLIVNERQDEVRLYNLEKDISEKEELSEEEPEVLKELINAFREWEKTLMPSLWPSLMEIEFEIDGEKIIFPI
jgi:arylsulfatase A-like enzyme